MSKCILLYTPANLTELNKNDPKSIFQLSPLPMWISFEKQQQQRHQQKAAITKNQLTIDNYTHLLDVQKKRKEGSTHRLQGIINKWTKLDIVTQRETRQLNEINRKSTDGRERERKKVIYGGSSFGWHWNINTFQTGLKQCVSYTEPYTHTCMHGLDNGVDNVWKYQFSLG